MRKEVGNLTKAVITSLFIIGSTITVNAGQWNQDNTGWWYQSDNGSYYNNGWQWINGKCYYFGQDGYCFINTTTPDGYKVDAGGAWVSGGAAQNKNATETANQIQLSKDAVYNLTSLANIAYESKNDPYHSEVFDVNLKAGNLSSEEKAFILYWYQYNYAYVDGRLSDVESGSSLNYESYNTLRPEDLRDIMKEVLGSCNDDDVKTFEKNYVEKKSNGLYYMNNTGDFGDAGAYYLSGENVLYNLENGVLVLTGNVVQYQSNRNEYLPVKTYTAYFAPNSNSHISGYQFKQLIIQ
ncbi:hypothetical protein [Clostridium sp. HBUAS56010]|uniref:hypothetical protein n=1 Tax=Clostridium sp. HBUAS56010 TaxID=2571127 RepID=UPI001177609E|nr:hypothetical protein [Clostridium sp. HBUAS56010]